MVVLMEQLLALERVQSGVHQTYGGGHDILCTLFCWGGGMWVGGEPSAKFCKRGA